MPDEPLSEPWLRGSVPNVHPVISHLLRASEQICEDLGRTLDGLSKARLWATPDGMTSAGFHAKHLAGSTDRLSTYLEGRPLDNEQLAEMTAEKEGDESARELTARVHRVFARYQRLIRELTPEEFGAAREVGRLKLQTTAISLAIHIAEHGQRHVGQAISAGKLARARVQSDDAPGRQSGNPVPA